VQSISEVIQTIARTRARSAETSGAGAASARGGDREPLLATLPIEGATGERIAHLPIEPELSQAWVALSGEPFRPHQAHALTALRRGEPVALRASSADVATTAFLQLYAALLADPSATALLLAHDIGALQAIRAQLGRIDADLPRGLRVPATAVESGRRPDMYARIVIATPEAIHSRLLRHHDRAWRLFWPRLQLAILPEIQRYTGVAGAHLADLLIRIQRVAAAHSGHLPNLLATLEDVANYEPTLTSLIGQPWRVVPADDGPRQPTTLAVWRGGSARLRDAVEIATAMQRQGYQVHIGCRPGEQALLAPLVGDLARVTIGPELVTGQALVVAGYPGSHSRLRRMLRAGYQAVVLVLGELPHEQVLARRAASLLTDPEPAWVTPPPNAYVLAKNILCAASEQPLTEAEVLAWGVNDIVERLVAQGQLVDLPDPEVAWKPTDAAGDPYTDWGLHSSVGEANIARAEQGQFICEIQPAVYERWAFPNAALPPGAGGFRILSRDEDTGAITARPETIMRRTYPLRRCEVTVRETRETRALTGSRPMGWGRVLVDEEVYGYREMAGSGAPADLALKPALNTRWTAAACWFDLQAPLQLTGQLIGWSLAAALALRALADFTDVVPCYDHEKRRLYIVDAQPGGNGLAAWIYEHAEEVLPLAYDVAYNARTDPLLEPLSRVDMDWLLALLGPQRVDMPAPVVAPQSTPPQPKPSVPAPPRQIELIPGPPPDQQARFEGAPPSRSAPPQAERPAQQNAPRPEQPAKRPPDAGPARPPASSSAAPARPTRAEPPAGRRGATPPRPADPPPARGRPAPKPERPAPAPDDGPPDPAALIARLRRQREQREGQAGPGAGSGHHARQRRGDAGVEQRFAAGDRIFCLPYGDGTVRQSRVENGSELLLVEFPDYGEIEIDPAVSLVRKIEAAAPEDDDLL
jgi:ATP-dependent helicase YprA (DUF1998 family)